MLWECDDGDINMRCYDSPIFIVDVLLEIYIVSEILMDILALTIIMADDDFMGGIKQGDLPRKKKKIYLLILTI